MLHTYRGLVVGVSLMALASQSALPAWAATQDTAQRKISQSEFNKLPWPRRDDNKDLWRGASPSSVCQDATFSNLANCPQLAAKKWLNLYLKDPKNSFFFVNLNSLSQESDVIQMLKQVGKLTIPKEQIANLIQKLASAAAQAKKAAGSGLSKMLHDHGPLIVLEIMTGMVAGLAVGSLSLFPALGVLLLGVVLWPVTGGISVAIGVGGALSILLGGVTVGTVGGGLAVPGFITISSILKSFVSDPANLKNLIAPKVPIVQVPLLTDGIARTLAQDLPNLKLLRLEPDAKVDLTKGVDLSKLTLQVLGSPDKLDLKGLLDKTQIQRLDLVGINFNATGAGKVGTALGGRTLKHLDLTDSTINASGITALADGLGGQKLILNNLQLMNVFKEGDAVMGKAFAKLLPKLEVKTLNLNRGLWRADGLQALAKGLGDQTLEIPNVAWMNAFQDPGEATGLALGNLLPKFKTKVMGLGFNSFTPETIQGLAKALAGKTLQIEELNLVGSLKKEGYDQDMAVALGQLLPHLKAVKKVDLRGNEFGKKAKAAIKQKAKDLSMEQQVKL